MQSLHVLFSGEMELAAKSRPHLVLPPPKIQPLHDVFAEVMLEDSSGHQRRSPLHWIASIGVHFTILVVLLILAIYFTSELDIQKLNLMFLAPPLIPVAAPPPRPLASPPAPRVIRNIPAPTYPPGTLIAPSVVPKTAGTMPGEAAPADESWTGVPGGVPEGIPGGQVGGSIDGVLGGALRGVPAPPPPVEEGPKKPVRVGGDVKPPRLLYGPEPEYPVLAKQSRLSGVVVIEAIIDEHGNVSGMRVISGPALLIPAALSAVSKRKYEPTILDGKPTPIDLRVEIRFSSLMNLAQ